MSTTEMKTQIHDYLEQVDDALVQAIHTILNKQITQQSNPILGYSSNVEPIRTEEALERYEKSGKEFEAGNFMTIEELEEKDFKKLAQQQFLKGYAESDAIYDDK